MEITRYKVTIRLEEPLLGSSPKDKELYATYIASKAADQAQAEEELASVEQLESRGWTGFPTDDEGPFLYDYAIKGFLKEAARVLKTFGALKQLRSKVVQHVFVRPRKIRLPPIAAEPLERPLRAETALGPRTALMRSDVVAAGTEVSFELHVLASGGITEGCLREILAYGAFMGLGCWRGGGYGRFSVLELEEI